MEKFLLNLRNTDKYIEMIYLNGGCYKLHILLKTIYNGCEAFINKNKDHVITKYNGKYYDITGEVSGNLYDPITESDIKIVKEWSFHKTRVIQIKECPFCEEPITI